MRSCAGGWRRMASRTAKWRRCSARARSMTTTIPARAAASGAAVVRSPGRRLRRQWASEAAVVEALGTKTRETRGCPDPETMAAFLDGRLTGADRTRVIEHMAGCADCYFIFSESTRTAAAVPEGQRRTVVRGWFMRPRIVWSSAAGLAAAAALVVAVIAPWRSSPDAELKALVAAVGTERTFEPRLTGGFAYGPVRVVRGPESGPNVSPDVNIAVGRIEKAAGTHRTPRELDELGIAYLISGNVGRAVAVLEEAVDQKTPNARALSDLSAAYLIRAVRDNQPQDLANALTFADRALQADSKLA